MMTFGPLDSHWSVTFENTLRKNIIEKYSSREFIKNETMHTVKQSVALQHAVMNENTYKVFKLEVALPL